jgi:microcompartment protein CcmK/EutM
MLYAKVIGKTYSSFKHHALEGIDIKIIQELEIKTKNLVGKPFLALDPIGVAIGEYVGYEVSTQATWPFENKLVPTDSTITAIIDYISI